MQKKRSRISWAGTSEKYVRRQAYNGRIRSGAVEQACIGRIVMILVRLLLALTLLFLFEAGCGERVAKIPPLGASEDKKNAIALAELRVLTNAQLNVRFGKMLDGDGYHHLDEYEPCLVEMVRRGMADELEKAYETEKARKPDEPWGINNLELLTALRRAQGKPDPLLIQVELPDRAVYATMTSLPRLKATVENVDTGHETVNFRDGGDDRSGRRDRWRLVLLDEQGRKVPDAEYVSMSGGGVYSRSHLAFGERGDRVNVLDMSEYVTPPRPGKYQLQVLYHNQIAIVHREDLSGLIVSKSEPVTLIIEPVKIHLTKSEDEEIRALIAKIDATPPLKIVAGKYGEWAHHFVSPESPHGRLLAMGAKIAPALIGELDQKITPERRALLFALLFSVTGDHDPRDVFLGFNGRVLPVHSYVQGTWEVWGRPGEMMLGGSTGSGTWPRADNINAAIQKEWTKKWQAWLKDADVVVE